ACCGAWEVPTGPGHRPLFGTNSREVAERHGVVGRLVPFSRKSDLERPRGAASQTGLCAPSATNRHLPITSPSGQVGNVEMLQEWTLRAHRQSSTGEAGNLIAWLKTGVGNEPKGSDHRSGGRELFRAATLTGTSQIRRVCGTRRRLRWFKQPVSASHLEG